MTLQVNTNLLEAIRNREVENRDSVPEHTMDWYTYDNRVKLIDEIAETFSPVVRVPYEEPVKQEKEVKVEKPKAKVKTESANAGDPTDDLPKES